MENPTDLETGKIISPVRIDQVPCEQGVKAVEIPIIPITGHPRLVPAVEVKGAVASGHLIAVVHVHVAVAIDVKVDAAQMDRVNGAGGEEKDVEAADGSSEDSSGWIIGRALVGLDEVELDDLVVVDVGVVVVAQAGVESNVK